MPQLHRRGAFTKNLQFEFETLRGLSLDNACDVQSRPHKLDAVGMVPKSIKKPSKHAYSMPTARRKNNDCEDAPPEFQHSLLFLAAQAGDLYGVKLVIDCGVNPNIQNKDGDTPLHSAALNGKSEVVKLLLEHGADPNIQNKDGMTPLHFATEYSPWHFAARYSPWDSATERGYLRVVKLLLEHGADPNIQNKDGMTPLHFATERGSPEVVKLLLEHGADPNIQENKFGWTPLHYAVSRCHVDVVRVLLDHGADLTIRDNKGMTPLDYGSDCEEIIEELRRGGSRTMVYE